MEEAISKLNMEEAISKLNTVEKSNMAKASSTLNTVEKSNNAKLIEMEDIYNKNRSIIDGYINTLDEYIIKLVRDAKYLIDLNQDTRRRIVIIKQDYSKLFVKNRNKLQKTIQDELEKTIQDELEKTTRDELEKTTQDKKNEKDTTSNAAKYVKYKSKYLELR